MESDYTIAIASMLAVGALLTAAVTYVLTRPSDLGQQAKR